MGEIKKIFIDDIETIELLLAHAIPEGLSNFAVPGIVYLSMFFVDWKLALLSLCSLPAGLLTMGFMYKSGKSKMDSYYGAAKRMNSTIIEYINGMEVVKIFNRDGESYKRFEKDVHSYRDFTLDWYRVCRPWMALYNSILPCIAILTLPLGCWFVLKGYSTLPDLILVLCMSFGIGTPLLRALSFMGNIPQLNYKIENLEKALQADNEYIGLLPGTLLRYNQFFTLIAGSDITLGEVTAEADKWLRNEANLRRWNMWQHTRTEIVENTARMWRGCSTPA